MVNIIHQKSENASNVNCQIYNIQQGVSGCECDMRIYTPSTLLQKILEKILNGLEFEEVSGIFSLWYYRKSQRWQRREEEQLSEYWDSGLTIQEYSELKELPYESARRWILWLYLLYDFTKSSGYFRWNCNLLTICKRPASSMVMVDRGEIFSKGEMATKWMPSDDDNRPTAFIFLVNSHSKKSLFLLTMGLAGRIPLYRHSCA